MRTRLFHGLRGKALGPLALIAVVLLLLAIAIIWSLRAQQTAADRAEHADEAITRGNSLSRTLQAMESGIRGYRLTGDQSFLQPYSAGRTSFARDLESTRSFVRDNSDQ